MSETKKILSRTEFYYEMRDVLRDEKPSATGLVNISDVLDFIFDLGLEEATLLAFDEDEDKDLLVFSFSDDDEKICSLEVSDIE